MAYYRPWHGERKNRAETLGATVTRITNPVFMRRGLADGTIAKEWSQIVGSMIANHSQPERITYNDSKRQNGLLHLRVDHSAMATELQHLEPQLIERINGYFGFKAVAKMHFIHGPLAVVQTTRQISRSRPAPPEDRHVSNIVRQIDDPALREALNRLGNAVSMGRQSSE